MRSGVVLSDAAGRAQGGAPAVERARRSVQVQRRPVAIRWLLLAIVAAVAAG